MRRLGAHVVDQLWYWSGYASESVGQLSLLHRLRLILHSGGVRLTNICLPPLTPLQAFFNPAISLASFLVGSCSALRGLLLMAAHTFGALIAAAVIRVLIPGKFSAFVQLGHGTTAVQGFFLEVSSVLIMQGKKLKRCQMFATTLLIFTALYSFRQRTKATYLSPILIGSECICLTVYHVLYLSLSVHLPQHVS